jgi:hypothetical protein
MSDILTLGSDYTVTDSRGKVIKTIQVIPLTELHEAILGPYTESFGSFDSYIEKFRSLVSGLEAIKPYTILWYATTDEEVGLSEIIEYAVMNGYEKIVLEHLDELE